MSRQLWSETVGWAEAAGTAVASTAAETIIFPNTTIPGNFMQSGRLLRLRAFGQYSNTSTPTLVFSVRWGGVAGTLLCKTGLCTTPSGVTAAAWELDVLIQTRSNGATGTLMANGVARVFAAVAGTVASATGEALVTPMTAGGVTAPAVATVDLTTDAQLAVTATWGTSSGSNTLTGHNFVLEALN